MSIFIVRFPLYSTLRMAKFHKGQHFHSYEEVQTARKAYEDGHFVKFYVRNAERGKTRRPGSEINEELKYTRIQFIIEVKSNN